MVGNDAPGFHQVVNAVTQKPMIDQQTQIWLDRIHAKDNLIKSLTRRANRAEATNEQLVKHIIKLHETIREAVDIMNGLNGERGKA